MSSIHGSNTPSHIQQTYIVDVQLEYSDTYGGWVISAGQPIAAGPLPSGTQSVGLYCNGLRYHQRLDYTINNGVVVPLGFASWQHPEYVVTVDFLY